MVAPEMAADWLVASGWARMSDIKMGWKLKNIDTYE